ncbi:hypothetical protein I3842_08G121300 [Carya illinoinensis]|nr:hypothetical protein I3842_08G121300 [Carya illinoinensis]
MTLRVALTMAFVYINTNVLKILCTYKKSPVSTHTHVVGCVWFVIIYLNYPSFMYTPFRISFSSVVFVIISCSQENIPTATAEKVKAGMLEGVEAALGLSKGSLKKPLYTRVQLWGAALPTNTPGIPCIFDPQGRAGICGDWLLGSSLESAALSGMSLANHIADYFQSGGAHPEEFAVGLQNEFQPLEGHDVGQFPGLESEKKQMNEPELINLPPEVVSA